MKVAISAGYKAPRLKVDNPGGNWLRDKREYNAKEGVNRYGSPKTWGPITAAWDRQVLVPVRVLKQLRGMSNEGNAVRQADLAWLVEHMGKNGRLPLEGGKHYVPYLMVWQDGTPWVNEGNHRIMAAAALHFKYLPVQIRYFTGGEAQHGLLMPERVLEYDAFAASDGYTLTRYVK